LCTSACVESEAIGFNPAKLKISSVPGQSWALTKYMLVGCPLLHTFPALWAPHRLATYRCSLHVHRPIHIPVTSLHCSLSKANKPLDILSAGLFNEQFQLHYTQRGSSVFISPGTGWPSYTPRHWVPFPSPPATRRATVEVFEPASTRAENVRMLQIRRC
jgi:hypothetical protein